jgi:DNA repair protein RecO (recombination protein O)
MVDYRDSDRIVTLLTQDYGRLGALARGARKSRKRFGAALSPYHLVEARLRGEPSDGKLMRLADVRIEESYRQIASDMKRLALAGYFSELCRETVVEAQPEPAIFQHLVEGHRALNQLEPKRCTSRAFEIHLLRRLGVEPVLDRCVGQRGSAGCVRRPDEGGETGDAEGPSGRWGLDLVHGGMVCPECAVSAGTSCIRLSLEAVRAIQRLASVSFARGAASEDDLSHEVNAEIRKAFGAKLYDLIGRPLQSVAFIEKMRRWDPELESGEPVLVATEE